ncbi:hypothetical protein GBA52_008533 [Prunus armeniaca]|nr:hypothetical protein GBA52_008533 [Prunus armeniaca]
MHANRCCPNLHLANQQRIGKCGFEVSTRSSYNQSLATKLAYQYPIMLNNELFDPRLPDERRSTEISVRTTPTLCVQLNTLYYAISQLNKLEDSMWERWTRKKPSQKFTKKSIDEKSKSFTQKDTFDGSRKRYKCCYRSNLRVHWFEAVYEPLDTELSQLCAIIVEPLRDRIVTSLLQATLDGLLRVVLDGGPSRIFSLGDAKLLEEDLEVLKEFFISGGDGLPRGVVENQVARVRDVIKLHSYETRELIEDLKSSSGLGVQGGRSKLGADSKTLVRILCHRADSEASLFLKKQYKIPKSTA